MRKPTSFKCQRRFKEVTNRTHPLGPLNSFPPVPRGLNSQIKSKTPQPKQQVLLKPGGISVTWMKTRKRRRQTCSLEILLSVPRTDTSHFLARLILERLGAAEVMAGEAPRQHKRHAETHQEADHHLLHGFPAGLHKAVLAPHRGLQSPLHLERAGRVLLLFLFEVFRQTCKHRLQIKMTELHIILCPPAVSLTTFHVSYLPGSWFSCHSTQI